MSINIHSIKSVKLVEDALYIDSKGTPMCYTLDIRIKDSNEEEHVIHLYSSERDKPITIEETEVKI